MKNVYDNAGNMTGQTRYSNLAETTVVATTSYAYDAAEQLTGITDKNSGGDDPGFVRLHVRLRRPGDSGNTNLGLGVVIGRTRLHLYE